MIHYDPFDRATSADPYAIYARLREEAPVYHNADLNFCALSRYDDVVAAHRDAKLFSSAGGVTIDGAEAAMPLMIVKDQPEHNWAKGLVIKMFSRNRMAELDLFIRKRAIELLEEAYEKHGPDGEFNFVDEITVKLPLDVISELLGIPEEYRAEIHHWSNIGASRGDDYNAEDAMTAAIRVNAIYTGLAADRRANPRDDVVSMLIADEVVDENGVSHRMSDEEIGVRFSEMGFAGHETVAKAIPNAAMAMQKFPDQRALWKADRKLTDQAVDEIVRYDPPSQMQGRTTTADVTLHGVTIPKGSKTMLLTAAATRDPRGFERPDEFDITRPVDTKSIYFGFGVHKCLGIHLARQEIGIFYNEMFDRFPDFQVDPTRTKRLILTNVRGVTSIPIVLGKHA